ncbi:MAG: C10 family peptidase [Prevotella sp.]|nr:C10 family peptidase [Prevotella sp.]
MKQRILLSLSLLLSLIAAAAPVSLQQARQKAEAQLKGKNLVVAAQARQMSKGETPPYYVFNVENNGGFVIVSGDDRVPDILGYSDKGNLDLDRLPPNVAWWLSGYQKQLEAISQDASAAARAMESTKRAKVNPLVMTEWGQGYPYNDMCPVVNGQKCLTGCVATAMAQIMYYHHAPASACKTIFFPAIDHNFQFLDESELPSTTFDWSNMLLDYRQGSNEVQNRAIAKLMQYCGRALFTSYGLDVSLSADENIKLQLNDTFGYDNVSFVSRNNFSDEEWESLIYNELSARRPVAYSGDDEVSGGGHCFVCDGYDGEGMFHINWGWYGSANGFYRLSALIPNGYPNGFTGGQSAVIGIKSSDMAPGAVMKADDIVCEQGKEIGELTWTSGTMTIPQGTPKLSTTATKDSPVGIYPIIISRGSITENDLKLVNGKLTIVKTEPPRNLYLDGLLNYTDRRSIDGTVKVYATVVNPTDKDYTDFFVYRVKNRNGSYWREFLASMIPVDVAANDSELISFQINNLEAEKEYQIVFEYLENVNGNRQWKEMGSIELGRSEIENPVKKGDLNGDGKVSITDVVMIVDVIAGIITDANQRAAADVNGDGSVTITDCVAAIDLIAAQQTVK